MKRLAAAIMGLSIWTAAIAAENPQGAGAANADSSSGQNYSHAKYDEVLGRLKLTDEQVKKIDAIYREYSKKLTQIRNGYMEDKKLGNGRVVKTFKREAYQEYAAKQKALFAERDTRIFEVLTEDQQKLFEQAKAIIAEFDVQNKTLIDEMKTARQHMGNDRAKIQDFYKQIGEKRRKIYADRCKQLDEKVGKRPKFQEDGLVNQVQGTR